MSSLEQIIALEAELKALIQRFRLEFEIPYASVIGVLNMEAMTLHREAHEDAENE